VTTVEIVQGSFARCDSPEFYDTIYDIFLAKSPEVQKVFANTDFKRQKVILRTTVSLMVRFQLPDPRAQEVFEKVGTSHSREGHNIHPSLYALWLESLLESIDRHDPESSDEVKDAWRDYLQDGVAIIISKY
jgi:hemoglobin-like flavoprotein